MITILRATPRHGYTGVDHLISGDECADLIGHTARSWRDLYRAINAKWQRNSDIIGRPPISIRARIGTGDLVERDI